MKISLECKDLIIEKTLELFLKDYLVMKKIVILSLVMKKFTPQNPYLSSLRTLHF